MPNTGNPAYRGNSGKVYRLSSPLKKGGEGAIYHLQGDDTSLAKIYSQKKTPQELRALREKLQIMINLRMQIYQQGQLVLSLPQDLLEDQQGRFVGFIMPKVVNHKSLKVATRPSERKALLFGDSYTWKQSIATAYNLACMVRTLHKFGIVLGDMNTNNILVDPHAHVTLVDCDSFQLRSQTGKLYKCTVAMKELRPPELQGVDLRIPGNDFTLYSDRFALAIHIFTLLCNGFHPFNVVNPQYKGSSSSSLDPQAKNICQGYCPYVAPGGKAKLPPEAPPLEMLPAELQQLFQRAFRYDAATAVLPSTLKNRPSAAEWAEALHRLFNEEMTVCSQNREHVYRTAYGKCPWCAVEARKAPGKKPPHAASAQTYAQKAYQRVAPAPSAAQAQPTRTPTAPSRWTYTRGTYRKDASPLYLLCLIVGMVGAALPLKGALPVVRSLLEYPVPPGLILLVGLLFGLAGGWLVAARTRGLYLGARNPWPLLCLSLLAPIAAWIGMAVALLAISLVKAIVGIFSTLLFFLIIIAASSSS